MTQALIYIPAVSFWEIALLERLGKIKLRDGFARWSSALLAKRGFAILPLETSIIAQAVGYNFNNDLFDKVIVASAAEVGAPLISKDVAITESNLVEIWW
jgi:PIN domain nuclease of toxin-antitoxin system